MDGKRGFVEETQEQVLVRGVDLGGATTKWGIGDAVMEEFRQNGRDSEYCPELENGANKLAPVLQSVSQHFWRSMEGDVACVGLQNSFSSKKERRSTKQQPKECVFCKNNGEESVFYKGHVLKVHDNGLSSIVDRRIVNYGKLAQPLYSDFVVLEGRWEYTKNTHDDVNDAFKRSRKPLLIPLAQSEYP
uniref:Uncharacterized protein n=1 Tax=Timema douglasi TaxID=61478 RepID=A0A7R8VK42_TIMDO|nr:unnamed protein product [Timema douglasi]